MHDNLEYIILGEIMTDQILRKCSVWRQAQDSVRRRSFGGGARAYFAQGLNTSRRRAFPGLCPVQYARR